MKSFNKNLLKNVLIVLAITGWVIGIGFAIYQTINGGFN
jgi:hypothetical protein